MLKSGFPTRFRRFGELDDLAGVLARGELSDYLTFAGADGLPKVAWHARMTTERYGT
jgi:hypothetical protein